jgi:hypothetical protein
MFFNTISRPASAAKARLFAGIILLPSLIPAEALACACGCSTFEAGSSVLLPKSSDQQPGEDAQGAKEHEHGGGSVYIEWDYSDQNQNWSGSSKAPAANNGDKHIGTDWYVAGLNYMINRDWGFAVRVPYASRSFLTDLNFPEAPGQPTDIEKYHSNAVGDIQLTGMYTGFADDMSKGIIFGVKLPTGRYTEPGFDRDTQIGTGSTDLILGGFWRGMITGDNAWQYFSQFKYMQPVLTSKAWDGDAQANLNYRPGASVDAAAGIIYNNLYHVGPFDKIAPLLQLIYSHHERDSGAAADPDKTGYDRIFISPGIDFTKVIDDPNNNTMKLYGDIEIPVYQRVNGNQLVAPLVSKIILAYTF